MRGFRMGALLSGAMAALSIGFTNAKATSRRPKPEPAPALGHSGGYGSPVFPNRPSRQEAGRERLICDRASNVKKLGRWQRNGSVVLLEPELGRTKSRHRERARDAEIARNKARNAEEDGRMAVSRAGRA